MDYQTGHKDSLTLVGITLRLSNELEANKPQIPDTWQRFLSENMIDKIEHKRSNNLYCAYFDYESDENGAYTMLIGAQVNRVDNLPDELFYKTIPTAKYAIFNVNSREQVGATWHKIWDMKELPRTYTGDFEEYNQETGEIKIYIAIS